jgi:hypothetical protein
MRNLHTPAWITVKGLLFLVLGLLSSVLLIFEHPTLKDGIFLALAISSFCRFYYFAFYVIQRYVDPSYRFSGLLSLTHYLLTRQHRK